MVMVITSGLLKMENYQQNNLLLHLMTFCVRTNNDHLIDMRKMGRIVSNMMVLDWSEQTDLR